MYDGGPVGGAGVRPDYQGGGLVNLMVSLAEGLGGGRAGGYAPLEALAPAEVAGARHVVLLLLDGLGHDYLAAHGAGGMLGAHLRARLSSVFPPTTAAAVTTLFTAVAPQQHAVTGWFQYLRELGLVTAFLPFRARAGGPPLDRWGLSAADFIAAAPVFDRFEAEVSCLLPADLIESAYTRALSGSARRLGYRGLDEFAARIADLVRDAPRRRFIYAYWPEFDRLAHGHGISGAEVRAHFEVLDRSFGQLLERLRGTDTLVVAVADHGFIDCAAEDVVRLEDHPGLAECLTLPLCGEPRAAYCYVRPSAARRFERYIVEHLAQACELHPASALIEEGWLGLGPPAARLWERVGDYVLLMKGNRVIKDRLPGEAEFRQRGVHGGVSAAEMYVPLIVARC